MEHSVPHTTPSPASLPPPPPLLLWESRPCKRLSMAHLMMVRKQARDMENCHKGGHGGEDDQASGVAHDEV